VGPAPQNPADEAAEVAAPMPPAPCAADADFVAADDEAAGGDPEGEEARSPETRANAAGSS